MIRFDESRRVTPLPGTANHPLGSFMKAISGQTTQEKSTPPKK
jgi:hypothetical protein